ncbi:50S ribosomal protein L6 [Candidatus Falkowbacteria bacterium]|nr:50S ribosomal protein L6 [Candidatus Falkowbacteria bacterium]
MSRIGKLPIALPAGTNARIDGEYIIVKGPKGELKEKLHPFILVDISEQEINVKVANPTVKKENSMWGLFRSLINNMVEGVNKGYEKKLEINGVGYRAAIAGSKLTLNVGYSHPVEFVLPEGVTGSVAANVITLNCIDKYVLGETAAQIRKVRKPEPYKGKGIKYSDEVIRRKAGKTAAKGGK